MPSSNAVSVRRDSWHCGPCRGLRTAAPRLMCVPIQKIDPSDLKDVPSKVADRLTLPPKNVPLAECFNASKENGNDENSAGALHAGV